MDLYRVYEEAKRKWSRSLCVYERARIAELAICLFDCYTSKTGSRCVADVHQVELCFCVLLIISSGTTFVNTNMI